MSDETNQSPSQRVLMLDIDCLFDTRLATIDSIDSEAAAHLVKDINYWTRELDDWVTLTKGRVTQEQFNEAWQRRNATTLRRSVTTAIIPIVLRIVGQYESLKQDEFVTDDIVVELNMTRYQLTIDEREEILYHLSLVTDDQIVFTLNRMDLHEMTPQYVDDHYAGMILYEVGPWMRTHAEALGKHPLGHVSLVGPKIFENDPGQMSNAGKQTNISLFKAYMLPYIDIDFIDAKWFSMLRP